MGEMSGEAWAIIAIIGATASGVVAIVKAVGEQLHEIRAFRAESAAELQTMKVASAERGAEVKGKLEVIHTQTNHTLEQLRGEVLALNERNVQQYNERIEALERTLEEVRSRGGEQNLAVAQTEVLKAAVEQLGQSHPAAGQPEPPKVEERPAQEEKGN
jgi:hypothetical protein